MRDKVNRKYTSLIYGFLFFACLLRNACSIYFEYSNLENIKVTTIVLNILFTILEDGVLPAAIIYVISTIIFSIGVRKYVRYMTRFDFNIQVALVISCIYSLMGIVNFFSILNPIVNVVVSAIESTLVFVALILYYFLVIKKKYNFNPVENSNAFRVWFSALLVLQLIELAIGDGLLLLLNNSAQVIAQYPEFALSPLEEIMMLVDIGLYLGHVITIIVLVFLLRSKCEDYRDTGIRINVNGSDNIHTIHVDEANNNEQKENHNSSDDINDIFDL